MALFEREIERVIIVVARVLHHPDPLAVGLVQHAEGVQPDIAPVRVVFARTIGLRFRREEHVPVGRVHVVDRQRHRRRQFARIADRGLMRVRLLPVRAVEDHDACVLDRRSWREERVQQRAIDQQLSARLHGEQQRIGRQPPGARSRIDGGVREVDDGPTS